MRGLLRQENAQTGFLLGSCHPLVRSALRYEDGDSNNVEHIKVTDDGRIRLDEDQMRQAQDGAQAALVRI